MLYRRHLLPGGFHREQHNGLTQYAQVTPLMGQMDHFWTLSPQLLPSLGAVTVEILASGCLPQVVTSLISSCQVRQAVTSLNRTVPSWGEQERAAKAWWVMADSQESLQGKWKYHNHYEVLFFFFQTHMLLPWACSFCLFRFFKIGFNLCNSSS